MHTLSAWTTQTVSRDDSLSGEAQMCGVSGSLYRLPPWYVTSKHEGGVV